MDLAIFHYHLNRGGVSQVIHNHLRALATLQEADQPGRVIIFYGGRRSEWPAHPLGKDPPFPVDKVKIELLEYDEGTDADPDVLGATILKGLHRFELEPETTLLHFHNHALGKNLSLPGAMRQLNEAGYRILLQIHDFAEDFRPDNFRRMVEAIAPGRPLALCDALYPQAPGIHYAALNRRDYDLLHDAGVPHSRLHWLPNPVLELMQHPDAKQARAVAAFELGLAERDRLVIYPVRGIRRKNLAEMLLLSILDPEQSHYALTLAPLSPQEIQNYEHWRSLAVELDLPCHFNIAASGRLSFTEILAGADELLTTSVAEGFGMVFLEAWLANLRLIGRNLPEITADFIDSGVRFPNMYDQLAVPLDLIDLALWKDDMQRSYQAICEAYGVEPVSSTEQLRQLDETIEHGSVDFARLGPVAQESLIRDAQSSPVVREKLNVANPAIEATWNARRASADAQLGEALIASNREKVRSNYAIEVIGEKLQQVYGSLEQSKPRGEVTSLEHGEAILRAFVDIRRLHPIRFLS